MSTFAVANDVKPSAITTTTNSTQESLSESKRYQQQNKQNKKNSEGLYTALSSGLNSSGQPLDAGATGYFESRLGHNFGNIQVHDNNEAAQSARTLDADAYALGNDVVFAHGKFRPGTFQGDLLLAHELVHTLQQQK